MNNDNQNRTNRQTGIAPMTDHAPVSFMPDGRPAPDLLTEAEAVRYLRLDTVAVKNPSATLRRYREGGALRAVQISKAILYPLAELRKFVEKKTAEDPR